MPIRNIVIDNCQILVVVSNTNNQPGSRMADKAVISELSWRPLEEQQKAFPNMPHFLAPDDLPNLLRPTQRDEGLNIHVLSLACVADNEDEFREFVAGAYRKDATIICKETGETYRRQTRNINRAVDAWKVARRRGAAKAGGDAKGRNGLKAFWDGFCKIKDRWHRPSEPHNFSPDLLDEARITRNTAVNYLGYSRLEWRKLTAAKRERVLKRLAKEVKDAGF